MISRVSDLLPSYLDGKNIRAHNSIIEGVNRELYAGLLEAANLLSSNRQILFEDEYTVHLANDTSWEYVKVYHTDNSVDTVPVEEGVTEYTYTSSTPVSRVKMVTSEAVYTKRVDSVDGTLDVMGALLNIVRFDGESDYSYLMRIRYFCENVQSMDTALLYARVVFASRSIWLYPFRVLYDENPGRDWGGIIPEDYMLGYVFKVGAGVSHDVSGEIQDFLGQFLPCTRPLLFWRESVSDVFVEQPIQVGRYVIGGMRDNDGTYYPDVDLSVSLLFHDGTSYTCTLTTDDDGLVSLFHPKLYALDCVQIENDALDFVTAGSATLQNPVVTPAWYSWNYWSFEVDQTGYRTGQYSHPVYSNRGYGHHVIMGGMQFTGGRLNLRQYHLAGYVFDFRPIMDSLLVHLRTNGRLFAWFTSSEELERGARYDYPQDPPFGWILDEEGGNDWTDYYLVFKDGFGFLVMEDENGYFEVVHISMNLTTIPGSDTRMCIGNTGENNAFVYVEEFSRDISRFEEVISSVPSFDAPTSYEVFYGEQAVITGLLLRGNTGVDGATVELLKMGTVIRTTTTASDGSFTISYPTTIMDYGLPFQLRYARGLAEPVTQDIEITLKKHNVFLSVPDVTATLGDTANIEITLVDENGDNVTMGNVEVTLELLEDEEEGE